MDLRNQSSFKNRIDRGKDTGTKAEIENEKEPKPTLTLTWIDKYQQQTNPKASKNKTIKSSDSSDKVITRYKK